MRGIVVGLVFLLLMSPASALFVKEETYQAEASYHSPIIFLPGVMGSIIEDDNRWTTADELWPGNPQEDRTELAFLADGKTPEIEGSKISAVRVLRKAWGASIYDGFYVEMDKTGYRFNGQYGETSYLRKAYFDHAYDFRRGTEHQIPILEKKVDEVLKNTHSKKVILVAHSMGSLQAKAFASQNPDKVRAVILLSGPLNGAPRGFESLTEGYNFGAGKLITVNHVWEIGHNWPGIFHLSPNFTFAKQNGKDLTLEDTFTKGISYQQARHIPQEAFDKLAEKGITDPAQVTAELEKEYSGLSKAIVKENFDFRKKFDGLQTAPSVRVEIIHGDGQPTTQSFTVEDELFTSTHSYVTGYTENMDGERVNTYSPYQFTIRRFRQVNSNEGDETVSNAGFTWASSKKSQSVNAGHMAMASMPETSGMLMAIVEDLNHDARDKAWVESMQSVARSHLDLVKFRSESAAAQSQEYGDAYKEEMKKEKRDEGFIKKLLGDIKGRGKYAFVDSLIVGKRNNIQIIVPEMGMYDDKNKDFKAYLALDSYNIVEASIGEISPADYVVTMDKDTFNAITTNQLSLKEAFSSGRISISGGFTERMMGWIGTWVAKYTSGD